MIHNNMRKAMAAGSAGSHIDQIPTVNPTTQYPETYYESAFEEITGATTENRLTVEASNTIGWYFNIQKWNAAQTQQLWNFYSISEMNSGNALVSAGELLYVSTEYYGIEMLPQSTTLTIRNATFGNEIVWQINHTLNPAPA